MHFPLLHFVADRKKTLPAGVLCGTPARTEPEARRYILFAGRVFFGVVSALCADGGRPQGSKHFCFATTQKGFVTSQGCFAATQGDYVASQRDYAATQGAFAAKQSDSVTTQSCFDTKHFCSVATQSDYATKHFCFVTDQSVSGKTK